MLFKAFTSALAHKVRDSRLLKWGPRRCSAPPSMESTYRSLILASLGPIELLHGAGYTRVARHFQVRCQPTVHCLAACAKRNVRHHALERGRNKKIKYRSSLEQTGSRHLLL